MKIYPDIEIKITDGYLDSNGYFNSINEAWVEALDFREAIEKYKDWFDIVLLSWPPYNESMAREVWELLPKNKKLLYIGEDEWGCTADDSFFEAVEGKEIATDYIDTFPGIYDRIVVYQK